MHNLPAPIVAAVTNNLYSRGTANISVTNLIEPPKLAALEELHQEDLTEDVSSQIYSLMGTAMHAVLERAGIESGKGSTEQRLYMTVDVGDGEPWVLSGQFDYIDEEGVLWDWKFVSAYEYLNGVKASREQQLNVYASLAAANGYKVTGLRVGFIFRDWSQRSAVSDSSYPQSQAVEVPISYWPELETSRFIQERVKLHKVARQDPQSLDCTEAERWAKPETWAVKKSANKRALRVFDSEAYANAFTTDQRDHNPKSKYAIEHRLGESTRCKYYCPVLKYCNQGQGYL